MGALITLLIGAAVGASGTWAYMQRKVKQDVVSEAETPQDAPDSPTSQADPGESQAATAEV